MQNISIILVRPHISENIGMAARACANMGCNNLWLVRPENWNVERAAKLATSQGHEILKNLKIYENLEDAAADCQVIYATTARLGGFRRKYITPEKCAKNIANASHLKTGILFGREDRGLSNKEIKYAKELIHIPTAPNASSLNLAQCVLLVLYCLSQQEHMESQGSKSGQKLITGREQLLLEENFKTVLMDLNCLHGDNPEYFFQQWREILRKAQLQRHEFDALMGLCRQIRNKIG